MKCTIQLTAQFKTKTCKTIAQRGMNNCIELFSIRVQAEVIDFLGQFRGARLIKRENI